jgi:hypothetical protein
MKYFVMIFALFLFPAIAQEELAPCKVEHHQEILRFINYKATRWQHGVPTTYWTGWIYIKDEKDWKDWQIFLKSLNLEYKVYSIRGYLPPPDTL